MEEGLDRACVEPCQSFRMAPNREKRELPLVALERKCVDGGLPGAVPAGGGAILGTAGAAVSGAGSKYTGARRGRDRRREAGTPLAKALWACAGN
jgi:hypothetical protein